ncbi:MAG: ATP-dependent Clp protease ATP-binding subunit, partial [Sphingobacteriales bacterium]
IHDKLGKEGDFSNALILFTSNIGSQDIVARFERNEIPSSGELMQVMSSKFRPEFLARITEIVPFGPITEDIAGRIFRIQLKALIQPLQRLGITFTISDEAVHQLATMGFSSQYGARQIGGIIRSQLTRPVSRKIVADEIRSGHELQVSWDEEREQIRWQVHEAQPQSV